jgi:hypothetical protein
MSRVRIAALVLGALSLGLVSSAVAAPLSWTIDSSKSQISLAIPDQTETVNGFPVTVRVRNQNGVGTVWNVGSAASLVGTLETNYTDGSSIEFLSAPAGQIMADHTGSHRPNPAAWNGSQYTDTTGFPGAYAFLLRAGALPEQADLAYFALRNVSYELTTGALAISGGNFAANSGMTFGIAASILGIDGLVVPPSGQPVNDALFLPGVMTDSNTSPTATIVSGGGGLRTLTIPISTPFELTFQGITLAGTMSGTIVATAVVPEPPSLMLGGVALAALAAAGWRRSILRAS